MQVKKQDPPRLSPDAKKSGFFVVILTFFGVVVAFGILYLFLVLFRDSIANFYHPRN